MTLSLQGTESKRALLIAGPTASGKSAAARALAEQAAAGGRKAWIVNADSMQVYDALRVLTARPGPDEMARIPHRLYGHVPAETRHSVGAWLADIRGVVAEAEAEEALLLVVGGTGLYFKALTEGLAAMPAVPPGVRRSLSARLAAEGPLALHAFLRERDPAAAAAVRPSDGQRILRALEVLEGTGRRLGVWLNQSTDPPVIRADLATGWILEPDRAELYRRIDARFDRMVAQGALDEVRALLQRNLEPDLPVMKAIGVRELARFLRGEASLEEAVRRAKTETRRYAKRQSTWFRNQMPDWERIAT
jgi:tRNA dimethylallyltransferase